MGWISALRLYLKYMNTFCICISIITGIYLFIFFQNIKLTDKNVIQNIKFICGKKPRLVGYSVLFSKKCY